MESVYKELSKLESLGSAPSSTPSTKKPKLKPACPTIYHILDHLVDRLTAAQQQLSRSGNWNNAAELLDLLEADIKGSKENVEETLKTYHKMIGKVGTALTKAMPDSQLSEAPPKFTSPESLKLLDQAIVSSLTRKAEDRTIKVFQEEHGMEISTNELENARVLRKTLDAIHDGDLTLALMWATANATFLNDRSSPLLFNLYRSLFLRKMIPSLLSLPIPPSPTSELMAFIQQNFAPLYSSHSVQIKRLLTALLYASSPNTFLSSPYADLADPALHAPLLAPLFEKEFCEKLGWPREEVLGLAVGLGASVSLGKIEKARKVMKARVGQDWEIKDELPVEIALPSSLRFHSTFTCPVSREQATPANPPMMLICGHTIARDSFAKLGKGTMHRLISRTVKCPYCPMETSVNSALELHF